jgi:hypothetical protein
MPNLNLVGGERRGEREITNRSLPLEFKKQK